MTFYVILKWMPVSNAADAKFDWKDISDPYMYLTAKAKMQELKRLNPKDKFRLIKTSY